MDSSDKSTMIRLRSGYTVLTDESDSMESLMVTARVAGCV